jgi:hypothetical protein
MLPVSDVAMFFGARGRISTMAAPKRNYGISENSQLFIEFPFSLSQ